MHVLSAGISGFCKDVPASFSLANPGTAGDKTRALRAQRKLRGVTYILDQVWQPLQHSKLLWLDADQCKRDTKVHRRYPISAGIAHCGFKIEIASATAQSITQAKQWMLGFSEEILVSRASTQVPEMRKTPEKSESVQDHLEQDQM